MLEHYEAHWSNSEFLDYKDNITEVIMKLKQDLLDYHARTLLLQEEVNEVYNIELRLNKDSLLMVSYDGAYRSFTLYIYLELLLRIDMLSIPSKEFGNIILTTDIFAYGDLINYKNKDGRLNVGRIVYEDGMIHTTAVVSKLFASSYFLNNVDFIGNFAYVNFSKHNMKGIKVGEVSLLYLFYTEDKDIQRDLLSWVTDEVDNIKEISIEARWLGKLRGLEEIHKQFLYKLSDIAYKKGMHNLIIENKENYNVLTSLGDVKNLLWGR